MADTYASMTVNGQLIPVFQDSGLRGGNGIGPVYHSNGSTPPQSIPYGVGGVDTSASVTDAGAMPLSPSKSPIVLLLGMLIVGLLILRYVHWRKS